MTSTDDAPYLRSAAALVLLTLPALPSVGRCAGQQTRREIDRPAVLRRTDEAQQAAERRAGARVFGGSVRAALVVLCDPDEAYQLLKTILDEIRDDPALSEAGRARLEARLEWSLWGVWKTGV